MSQYERISRYKTFGIQTYKKLLIVGMIQATCIPQAKATHFNQVLNTFYYPYTDKTSSTDLTIYFGQGLVAPLNHQHIT